ncbi:MAG TPA: hypothetical protein VMF89_24710 [Polyangiales bacterium]|nr:hypothetical protein [Polyangiales bacterium]
MRLATRTIVAIGACAWCLFGGAGSLAGHACSALSHVLQVIDF